MRSLTEFRSLLLASILFVSAIAARAQSKEASSSKPYATLTDEQKKGEELFVQRCSVCHMPYRTKTKWESGPPFGPSLRGVLMNAKPAKEEAMRQFILKGSDKMPGFQYGFTSEDLNVVIAYLKTM